MLFFICLFLPNLYTYKSLRRFNMKKFNLISSIVCSVVAIFSIVLFYILVGTKVINNNNRAILAFVFILVCAWLPFLAEIIFKLKFTKLSLIFYHVFLVLSLILGSTWDLYTIMPFYDSILHTLSGVLIASLISGKLRAVDLMAKTAPIIWVILPILFAIALFLLKNIIN